jgi:tetratricopeptide (TPR) repeat protein
MNGVRSIRILLSIVLLQVAVDAVLAVETDTRVPTLTARSRSKGIFRFDNETFDSLFGGSKAHRVERDHAAGAAQLEPEAESTVLAIPRSETRTAKFSRRTSPRRAAALRIAEKGRAVMKAGEYETALLAFEKSLALDPNPYLYYDLAHAHHHLAEYRESSSFIDAAQPWLVDYPEWASALAKIKNENGRALARQTAAKRAMQQESRPDDKPENSSVNEPNAFIGYLFAVSFGVMVLYFLISAVRKIEASLSSHQPPAQP